MNQALKIATLAACLLLGACDKPASPSSAKAPPPKQDPSTRGCEDTEVQVMAKKLLVMYLKNAMTPKTDSQRTMERYTREVTRDTDTLFNAIRSKYIQVDKVSFSEVTELQRPPAPVQAASAAASSAEAVAARPDEAGSTGPGPAARSLQRPASAKENYLFVCSTKASVPLPPAAIQRMAQLAKAAPDLIDVQQNRFSPRIIYTTGLSRTGEFEVGMALQNPMMAMMVEMLLRDAAKPAEPAASPATQ